MEAIILAGGFGTRLAHVVSDVPKPMASVSGKPFLQYIVDDMIKKGVTRIVLAVGYKQNVIRGFFRDEYQNVPICYSSEDEPLYTGGAIKKALQCCREDSVFVFNGDTFFDVDLAQMQRKHRESGAVVTIATKHMEHFERYGTVRSEGDRIVSFVEKQPCEFGNINGGIYLCRKDAVLTIPADKFSFENDFLEKNVQTLKMSVFPSEGYFIDIGIPSDYEKAQKDFAEQ